MADDEAEAGVRHTRAVAVEQNRLDERREHHPLVHQLLDLVQDRRAALGIMLAGLLLIETVDIRGAAVRS